MASMLMGDLYTLSPQTRSEGKLFAVLRLQAAHPIFSGHFPGQPVLPGACLLQMIREILQAELAQPVRLSVAHNLKFIAPVDPVKNTELRLTLTYQANDNGWMVNANFSYNDITCCKFGGFFLAARQSAPDL